MNNIILHKRSDEENKAPQPKDLQYGELAINYKKDSEAIYIKNDQDEIISFIGSHLLENYEFKLVDFTVTVPGGNVLTPMTNNALPQAGSNNGVVDIPVKSEFVNEWAMCSLVKWEVFNSSNQRIVAVPAFSFSMKDETTGIGQAILRVGFKTCGSTNVPFTKVSGAVLYKHRE